METKLPRPPSRRHLQSGMTLIETVIALAILLVVAGGIMTVAVIGTTTTENQGNLAARTTEYAQDKMEQLIALNYADSVSDTTVFPSLPSGGTGLTVGGSVCFSNCAYGAATAPVTTPGTGYVDYLDATGTPTDSTHAYYTRVWQISQSAANIKQLTVSCKIAYGVGGSGIGLLPVSTLTSLKAFPF